MWDIRILLLEIGHPGPIGEELESLLLANAAGVAVERELITGAKPDRARDLALHSSGSVCFALPNGCAEAGALLQRFVDVPTAPPVIVAVNSQEPATELMTLANDFVMAPLRAAEVMSRLQRWGRCEPAEKAEVALIKERLGLRQLIGTSPLFASAVKKIPAIARSEATVMILGETGTGKEVFARAIHYIGKNAAGPFLPVNCGAIPVELMENELFGHAAGAYTGAGSAAHGLIKESDGGTLFLDEIDSLPLSAQVKLLRFLQDREFRPLGSQKSEKAEVRVIAATNTDIQELVRKKLFREDLFYRLNVLTMQLPPLRQRGEDVVALALHFLRKLRARTPGAPKIISPAALRRLQGYRWPGNVRELENVIEGSSVFCAGDSIEAADIRLPASANEPENESFQAQKARVIADFEESYIRRALAAHHNNISQAARAAGKDRRSFWELLRKYQLHRSVSHPQVAVQSARANSPHPMGKSARPR